MTYRTVLDTPYETGLRMLLLLRAVNGNVTCDRLAALDTLTVNAGTLGVGERDISTVCIDWPPERSGAESRSRMKR
ncbi:ABC-three component system middle component 2 [Bifidobacterium parmae]|uniref:Uncharacterized protein n=1 Tax=Bifidobacterium parmae TaxID=361854 RepID=A0A2N5IZB7_9BIFI|nr:ABC-three component system middle component 2 [Bifidobacterium parmae]PLS27302.1 hypothetical protein Uis4E_1698 [Bifidobacterium parmae]